jgi:hypothetical protein
MEEARNWCNSQMGFINVLSFPSTSVFPLFSPAVRLTSLGSPFLTPLFAKQSGKEMLREWLNGEKKIVPLVLPVPFRFEASSCKTALLRSFFFSFSLKGKQS